jgi:hypothetical protein
MSKKAHALSLIHSACVDQEPIIEASEKLAGNSLGPGHFENANLNPAILNAANLETMASSTSGRATLPYVIGCALALGASVTTTYLDGVIPTQITFYGEIGLATTWQSSGLTVSQQRLVSGCALARVNELGTSVTISLRGPSTALGAKAAEITAYPKFEGVFFGNVFAGALQFAACRGTGTALPSGRTCAMENTGGLTFCRYEYAGLCADVCSTLVTTATHTYYQNCTSNGTTYVEAITTHDQ